MSPPGCCKRCLNWPLIFSSVTILKAFIAQLTLLEPCIATLDRTKLHDMLCPLFENWDEISIYLGLDLLHPFGSHILSTKSLCTHGMREGIVRPQGRWRWIHDLELLALSYVLPTYGFVYLLSVRGFLQSISSEFCVYCQQQYTITSSIWSWMFASRWCVWVVSTTSMLYPVQSWDYSFQICIPAKLLAIISWIASV
jgi:hypothetical protein